MADNRVVKQSIKCQLCAFEAPAISLVLSHLRTVHSSDPNFNVICGIGGCCTTFKTFNSLYQHIYRKHNVPGVVQPRKQKGSLPVSSGSEIPATSVTDQHMDHSNPIDISGENA